MNWNANTTGPCPACQGKGCQRCGWTGSHEGFTGTGYAGSRVVVAPELVLEARAQAKIGQWTGGYFRSQS